MPVDANFPQHLFEFSTISIIKVEHALIKCVPVAECHVAMLPSLYGGGVVF